MEYSNQDWLAIEPTGWTPIIGLVLTAVGIMVVFRAVWWAITHIRTKPVGYDELPIIAAEIEPRSPAPYWPAVRPEPVLVGVRFAPPVVATAATVRAVQVATMALPVVTPTATVVGAAEVTNLPALVEDELGAWDPDAADWLAPAVYIETLDFTLRRNPGVLSQRHKAELGYVVRSNALAMADALMTRETT